VLGLRIALSCESIARVLCAGSETGDLAIGLALGSKFGLGLRIQCRLVRASSHECPKGGHLSLGTSVLSWNVEDFEKEEGSIHSPALLNESALYFVLYAHFILAFLPRCHVLCEAVVPLTRVLWCEGHLAPASQLPHIVCQLLRPALFSLPHLLF
jgi:hypothetical protein